jgi:hypothetical protein
MRINVLIGIVLCFVLITISGCLCFNGCKPDSDQQGGILDPNNIVDSAPAFVTKLIYKTNWLTTMALIGIAASAAAFITGQSYALPLFAGCSALLTTILAMAQYSKWIALGGMLISVGIFVYVAIKRNKSTKTTENALKDVVIGVEKVKKSILGKVENDLTDRVSLKKKEINGMLRGCQSDDTVKLVSSIKEDIIPDTKGKEE